MSYYSNWYRQTVNNCNSGSSSSNNTTVNTLFTPAQVTVCSARDKLVYNIEYKAESEKIINKPKTPTKRFARERTTTSDTFASANAMAARFQNLHSRNGSTFSNISSASDLSNLSNLSTLSGESMWDDWIVKYLDKDKDTTSDDSPMEEWIFDTM